jgi:hypothetical protein
LAEQLKDLQTLGQRYDKSKKLSALFLNIEDIVINAENSPPQQTLVDAFRTKLENIQEVASLFRKFEENLDENVTPFRVRIEQLEAIAKAYAAKDATLKQLQALGTPDQLGRAILTYPRTSVERLHAIIPEEDEDRISLFGLIAQLQTRAAQTPRPDLRIDHAAIAVKFSKILRRYQDQKQQQFELGISQHLQIKEWVQERLQAITNQRDQSRLELAEKFKILQRDTKQLGRKVEQVELQSPPLFRVARVVPGLPSHLDGLKDKHLRMITNLTDAAYDFITSEEVPEALTRLTLGEVIRTHKK